MTKIEKEVLKMSFEGLVETLDESIWEFFEALTEEEEDNIDSTKIKDLCNKIPIPIHITHKNGIGFLGDIKKEEI